MHQDMNNWSAGGGWYETALNPNMPDGQKYVLLETASGHVGETLGAIDGPITERTYQECIRTATVALAWATAIRKGKGKQWAATR
jgi:hypothetical protein